MESRTYLHVSKNTETEIVSN